MKEYSEYKDILSIKTHIIQSSYNISKEILLGLKEDIKKYEVYL